jgi:hypothetical protein
MPSKSGFAGGAHCRVCARRNEADLAFRIGFHHFVCGILMGRGISTLDLWLRRKTRDQLWLWSGEGKAWLKTEEGQAWKQKTGYEE